MHLKGIWQTVCYLRIESNLSSLLCVLDSHVDVSLTLYAITFELNEISTYAGLGI